MNESHEHNASQKRGVKGQSFLIDKAMTLVSI